MQYIYLTKDSCPEYKRTLKTQKEGKQFHLKIGKIFEHISLNRIHK